MDRITKQVEFIKETDKLKSVLRKTAPLNCSRKENSAEHSWQATLTALVLAEYANETIDLIRVLKMLLVHDIVEVDADDTFLYHEQRQNAHIKEAKAANRLFGILPKEQEAELLELWMEFEAKKSPEAQFAAAVDRLVPIILNVYANGGSWKELGITAQQVMEKNQHIQNGSRFLWDFAQHLIQESIKNGDLRSEITTIT